MICKKCNNQSPEGSRVCQWCGEPLILPVESPQQESPAQELVPRRCRLCGKEAQPQETFCSACGFPLNGEKKQTQPRQEQKMCPFCNQPIRTGAKFCNTCGAMIVPDGAVTDKKTPDFGGAVSGQMPKEESAPKQKNKWKKALHGRKKLLTGIGIAAGALVALILVISLIASLAGWSGPFTKLAKGSNALIDAKSFTAEFELEGGGDEIEGTLELQFNLKKREVTMLLETSVDGEDYVIAIYDEYLINESPSGRVYAEDISEQLEVFFDNLEDPEYESVDEVMEELVDSIMESEDAEDIFDGDKLESCLRKLLRKLNTASWLRKNAGYSTKLEDGMTMHVFEPDLKDFATAAMKILEPAFQDEDDYEDMMDSLDDTEDELETVDIEFAFGLRFGKLSRISFEVDVEDEGTYSGEINFSKIGTTRVDTDRLDDLLDDAE